jgi:hypothetical protein
MKTVGLCASSTDFNLAGRLAGFGGVCRYVTDKQGNKKMISL